MRVLHGHDMDDVDVGDCALVLATFLVAEVKEDDIFRIGSAGPSESVGFVSKASVGRSEDILENDGSL